MSLPPYFWTINILGYSRLYKAFENTSTLGGSYNFLSPWLSHAFSHHSLFYIHLYQGPVSCQKWSCRPNSFLQPQQTYDASFFTIKNLWTSSFWTCIRTSRVCLFTFGVLMIFCSCWSMILIVSYYVNYLSAIFKPTLLSIWTIRYIYHVSHEAKENYWILQPKAKILWFCNHWLQKSIRHSALISASYFVNIFFMPSIIIIFDSLSRFFSVYWCFLFAVLLLLYHFSWYIVVFWWNANISYGTLIFWCFLWCFGVV